MKELPTGWGELSSIEQSAADHRFWHGLSFNSYRNEAGQRTIIEPANSITYKLASMGPYLSDEYKRRTLTMCRDYVRFLRRVVAIDDFVVAYDPHHSCFKFWPHQNFEYEGMGDWPVTPYPDGDYTAFFSSNLENCVYGFMSEPHSVCVIGSRFVDTITDVRPSSFESVLRISGK